MRFFLFLKREEEEEKEYERKNDDERNEKKREDYLDDDDEFGDDDDDEFGVAMVVWNGDDEFGDDDEFDPVVAEFILVFVRQIVFVWNGRATRRGDYRWRSGRVRRSHQSCAARDESDVRGETRDVGRDVFERGVHSVESAFERVA